MKATTAAMVAAFLGLVFTFDGAAGAAKAGNALRVVPAGAMSVARAAHQATVLHTGEVLITGGCAGSCDEIHASAELYDPASRTFRSAGDMHAPRASHVAVPLPDGRVLIAGGWSGTQATAGAEIYDPGANRFVVTDSMEQARANPVAAILPDGRVLIAGGGGGALGLTPLASAEIFDPETETFSAVGNMQTPRQSHVAVALEDGRVLVVGGNRVRGGGILRSAEIFDPATGTFHATGDMGVARHKHAALRLADRKVLIAGGSGEGDYGERHASTEIYAPSTGRFSAGPAMRHARHKLRDALVLLPSGDALVAGGAERVELFDAQSRRFTVVAGLLEGERMFATASVLDNGDVLITGGYDERIRSSAAAWLVTERR